MQLTLQRNDLWRGLDSVLDAVPAKPALPVLNTILLTAHDNTLSLAGTDLALSIETRIPAVVTVPGAVAIPARALADLIREWPAGQLSLAVVGERLTLSGRLNDSARREASYALSGVAAADFPELQTQLHGVSVDFAAVDGLDAAQLSRMISRTVFAVAKDDTRPVLNGVLWRLTPDGMDMVATDGHRFAHTRRSLDLAGAISAPAEAIVPPAMLAQLAKLLNAHAGRAQVTIGDSQLLVAAGETTVLSRLIEGPYVDYGPVIPRDNDKRVQLPTDQLIPAVRRVSILASSYTHQVRFRLTPEILELSAVSPEIGAEAHETVPTDYNGEPLEVGYNANYLVEILRKLDTPEVIIELKNHTTAAILRPAEPVAGEDYYCLLMPLRPTS
jgi:DNA polymerase-3 subunit beta